MKKNINKNDVPSVFARLVMFSSLIVGLVTIVSILFHSCS